MTTGLRTGPTSCVSQDVDLTDHGRRRRDSRGPDVTTLPGRLGGVHDIRQRPFPQVGGDCEHPQAATDGREHRPLATIVAPRDSRLISMLRRAGAPTAGFSPRLPSGLLAVLTPTGDPLPQSHFPSPRTFTYGHIHRSEGTSRPPLSLLVRRRSQRIAVSVAVIRPRARACPAVGLLGHAVALPPSRPRLRTDRPETSSTSHALPRCRRQHSSRALTERDGGAPGTWSRRPHGDLIPVPEEGGHRSRRRRLGFAAMLTAAEQIGRAK
jgi:hypothetical protein